MIRSLQTSSNGARSLAVVPCDGDWNLCEAVSMILAGDRTMRYVPFEEFGLNATGAPPDSQGEAANDAGKSPDENGVDAKKELPETTPPKATWSRTPKTSKTQDAKDANDAKDAKDEPDASETSRVTVVGGFATDTGDDVPEAVFDVDARVLMVQVGTPEASVRSAARHFAAGELTGVVCVDRPRH